MADETPTAELEDQIRPEDTDDTLPKHWLSGSLKYDDFKPLTEGGSATIQTCLDRNLHRVVVYKKLHPHLQDSDLETKRFLREARVTAMIPHPGTVPLYELGRDRTGALYFTMKKLEGRDMRSILMDLAAKDPKTQEQFPLPRLIDVLIQACQTTAYAHAHGVIHRDLKPANILVGGFGEVMVLDWGLAKVRGETAVEEDLSTTGEKGISLALTKPGQRYGTPLYMSPEQARADAEIDERTDVFNLGSILFEILTHRNLVQATTIDEAMQQILQRPTPVPHELAPDLNVPPELEAICLHALEKNPADRYAGPMELAEDLQNYRDGQPVSVYRYGPWARLTRWRRRHAVALAIGAAIAGGMLLGWLLAQA